MDTPDLQQKKEHARSLLVALEALTLSDKDNPKFQQDLQFMKEVIEATSDVDALDEIVVQLINTVNGMRKNTEKTLGLIQKIEQDADQKIDTIEAEANINNAIF